MLSSGTARLPKKLRQVAIHLWQHPTAVALGTVTSVADEAGVQPSTLVRFAQAFGYSGFSDLQDVFKAYLADGGRRTATTRIRIGRAIRAAKPRASSTASLARRRRRLPQVRDRLDLAQFELMRQTLAAAELIYIIGSKRAFSLASYVSLALANLGVRNLALDNVGSTAFELLRCATATDAVLAISFTPYNSITPELAASAAQRGVPIVSLTDSAFSPLVPDFEGLCRGGRRELFRIQVALRDACGRDGSGPAGRAAESRSGELRARIADNARQAPSGEGESRERVDKLEGPRLWEEP